MKKAETGAVSGWAIVLSLFLFAVIAVPAMMGAFGGSSPEDWLRDNYEHTSGDDPENDGIKFHSDDSSAETADAIQSGTDADDQKSDDDTHYLRYGDDWMVVVAADDSGGSEIEFYEFDEGYNHYAFVGGFWSGYYLSGGKPGGFFRGGGSGFGK